MATLGDGEALNCNGVSAKMIRRGATGIGSGDGIGLWLAWGGGGVRDQADGGDMAGVATLGSAWLGTLGLATLGSAWLGTLGRPGVGMRACELVGGLRRRHDSKRSRSLVMASSWVMGDGRGVSLRALAMA